jgi:hypothetical protein
MWKAWKKRNAYGVLMRNLKARYRLVDYAGRIVDGISNHYKSLFHVFLPISYEKSITLHHTGGWNPTAATIRNKIFLYDKPLLWDFNPT